jgi:hypothetical protein
MTRTVENKNVVAVNEGVKTMENKEQQFNTFDWVKGNILKAYYNALVNKDIPEDGVYEVTMNGRYQGQVFQWLYKQSALKVVSIKSETFTNENNELKYKHTVYIKELNLDAKATSKAGKEFDVFSARDKQKAKARILDSIVA